MTLIDADKLVENLIEAYVKNHFDMTLKEIIDIVYKMKDESTIIGNKVAIEPFNFTYTQTVDKNTAETMPQDVLHKMLVDRFKVEMSQKLVDIAKIKTVEIPEICQYITRFDVKLYKEIYSNTVEV